MNIFLLILGIAIQIIVLVDIFKTILYINGAGYLSGTASRIIWKLMFRLSKGDGKSRLLTLSGPIILIFFLFMWITLIWLGASLMFIADSTSVFVSGTQVPANIVEKIYYVGYILTSLGNGDYSAGHGTWQIISNLMGIHSMILISLGISYLLPILQAVIDKRTLAVQISLLGATPIEIISNGYNGKNFKSLYYRLAEIEKLLIKHGERHLAYPILHYFHSNDKTYALPLNLAALDEAMIIQKVYQLDDSENKFQWEVLEHSLDNFFKRIDSTFLSEIETVPPFDYADQLSEFIDKDPKDFSWQNVDHFNKRRRRAHAYVKSDGWTWHDVVDNR